MLCSEHKKFVEGPCLLCGLPLCEKCVTKKERRKMYCRFCSEKAITLPHVERMEPKKETKLNERITKILQTNKSGYFDFSVIKKL